VSPRAADVVRKALGGALAACLTVLLFRVLSRAAEGRASLRDPELWATLALGALGFLWVGWARRVSAARPWREGTGDGGEGADAPGRRPGQ
jgi:hypothetical protein